MSNPPQGQKDFHRIFHEGLEFWTSEDGNMLAVVIDRLEGWQDRLRFHHPSLWEREQFDAARAKPKFAMREWAGKDFFDGGFQRRGKVWRVCDEETPFPVMEYELQVVR